jgi:hypothetical protein
MPLTSARTTEREVEVMVTVMEVAVEVLVVVRVVRRVVRWEEARAVKGWRKRTGRVRTSGGSGCLSRRSEVGFVSVGLCDGWRGFWRVRAVFCALRLVCLFALLFGLFRGCRRRVAVGGVGDGETGSISL